MNSRQPQNALLAQSLANASSVGGAERRLE
jgi:hypothetical protein